MTERTQTEQDLAQGLRLAVTRLARRLRKEAETGISPSMLSALSTIERSPVPLTIGELAAAEGVQPPSATAVVGRLLEAGLVTRDADPDDGRVYRLGMTKDGLRLLERTRSRKNAYLARRLGNLTDDERAALERALPLLDRLHEDSSEGRS